MKSVSTAEYDKAKAKGKPAEKRILGTLRGGFKLGKDFYYHPGRSRGPMKVDFKGQSKVLEARERIQEARDLVVEAGMFALDFGAGKMRALKNTPIFPNQIYYLGASSSPDAIFVTRVTDGSVSYRDLYDLKKERSVQRPIADSLIRKGSETWIKSHGSRWAKDAKKLRALLDGKKQPPEKLSDWERHKVYVEAPSGKQKDTDALWREAEQYGAVGGEYTKYPDESEYALSIVGVRGGDLPKLKANRKWKVLSVTPEK